MSPKRQMFVLALAAAAAMTAGTSAASAATLHCGETVTADTTLQADLRDCPRHGLVVGAAGVTIDLNGHTIAGDGIDSTGTPDVGVLSEFHDGVTIENGTIEGFDIDGYLESAHGGRMRGLTVRDSSLSGILARNSTEVTLSGNHASDGFAGVTLLFTTASRATGNRVERYEESGVGDFGGAGNRIEGNLASDGDSGIVVEGSSGALVAHNRASGNGSAGIVLDSADRNRVVENAAAGNADGIVLAGDENRVAANVVTDTRGCDDECGNGISAEGGSRNVIEGNSVDRTTHAGIRVEAFAAPAVADIVRANLVRRAGTDGVAIDVEQAGPVDGTLVERNLAIRSGADGFHVRSATTTLRSNVALLNGAFGIDAVAGVIDGGGNRAAANGRSPQCINVLCTGGA